MPTPSFSGICGPNSRPCFLIWSNRIFSNKIGSYPDQFLPSKRTIWHSSDEGGFNFPPPLTGLGGSGLGGAAILGGGIIGGLSGQGLFGSDISVHVFRPQSHVSLIFANTANRINISHILTQNEIDSGEIDVGEYVFEAIAVTDQKHTIESELTEEELEDILFSQEKESDRAFRKLFEQNIPESRNRLNSVKINTIGIEYRLDNGSSQSNVVFDLPGFGDLKNPSYRDGSSRILLVDLKKIITDRIDTTNDTEQPASGTLQKEIREPRAGDIVYLTYVAVKKHYIRQSVKVSWMFTAQDVPPQCYPGIPSHKSANYRFYEWFIKDNEGQTKKIAGWRVVESFNIPSNVNCIVNSSIFSRGVLADFVAGPSSGIVAPQYLPADSTEEDILKFIENRATLPVYNPSVNVNNDLGGISYHINAGKPGSNSISYTNSSWYKENNFTRFDLFNKSIEHVFYNVHPQTMNKRDIDKWGIERSLAESLYKSTKESNMTFFPFMDDPKVSTPTSGSLEYLDNTNTLFQPILPVSRAFQPYMECGVGSSALLRTPSTSGDVLAFFFLESPIIEEKLEKGTRVLVERHVTFGGTQGTRTVSVEGLAGETKCVTCIQDPSKLQSFAFHTNNENFIVMNNFITQYLIDGLDKLEFRPDIAHNPDATTVESFEPLLGQSGMLGDYIGFQPGTIVSSSFYAPKTSFKYKTSNSNSLNDQTELLQYSISNNVLSINVGLNYNGRTEIAYKYDGDTFSSIFLFKEGSTVNNSMDGVEFKKTGDATYILKINHRWAKGDVIEIIGKHIQDLEIINITVTQLKEDFAKDFLNNSVSSSQAEVTNFKSNLFYDRSLFYETDIISVGENKKSVLFLFFNDKNNGISCIQSNDFGVSWNFYYGIVEPILENSAKNPFVIQYPNTNEMFVLYTLKNKLMCKYINCDDLVFNDSFIIQKFREDVLDISTNPPTEKTSLISEQGQTIRRRNLSSVVAGDLTDLEFLSIVGIENNTNSPTEERTVNNNETTNTIMVRKNPVNIGSHTAFSNQDIDTIYFSGYRSKNGDMKVFFLGQTTEGTQLQCHFSTDNGISWYDLWEYIEHKYDRLRADQVNKTQFIDKTANGPESNIFKTNPMFSNQQYDFGVNVHWSRLKRHKKEGADSSSFESISIDIDSPYVFYSPTTNNVFLFYVYQECLLCKVFSNDIFDESRKSKDKQEDINGIQYVKKIIEQNTRSHFVDGNLDNDEIKEEIHWYGNSITKERMSDGNIVFPSQFKLDQFNSDRVIGPQRVCAYELSNGNVRVFYKHSNSDKIKCAIWNDSEWNIEELMKNPSLYPPLELEKQDLIKVTGGFGSNKF